MKIQLIVILQYLQIILTITGLVLTRKSYKTVRETGDWRTAHGHQTEALLAAWLSFLFAQIAAFLQ